MKNKYPVILCLALTPLLAQCQMLSGETVKVRDKADHDLYIGGGTVQIQAPVIGDLIVAGGTVTVGDSVTQDILMVGGTLTLEGYVGDDIRCAGGNIYISGVIAGDVISSGATITLERNGHVKGNLITSGGEVTVDGQVDGRIQDASGTFTLNGRAQDMDSRAGKIRINGQVNGKSTMAASEIELGPQAVFEKEIRYWNKIGALDARSASGAPAVFDASLEMPGARWQYLGFATFMMVLWYLGMALVMIVVLQYLFSNIFRQAAETIRNASLKSLAWGGGFLIGFPALGLAVCLTLIGLPLGILMLMIYAAVILLFTAFIAIAIAHWFNNTFYSSRWTFWRIVFSSFGIFVILKFISLTPFIGPFLMLLLGCMTFGGLLQHIRRKKEKTKNLDLV